MRIPKPAKRTAARTKAALAKARARAKAQRERAKVRAATRRAKAGQIRAEKRARKAARKAARIAKRLAAPLPISRLEKLADDLHSVWLRASRGGCEMAPYPQHRAPAREAEPGSGCLGAGRHPSELQCAHGWPRGDQGVRFEAWNTWAVCKACHRRHSPDGALWDDWLRLRMGMQVYESVRQQALTLMVGTRKRVPADYLALIEERLSWIADLPDTIGKEWARERVDAMAERIRKARNVASK